MKKKRTGPTPGPRDPTRHARGRKRERSGLPAGSEVRGTLSVDQPRPSRTLTAALCLALGLATLAIYAQTYYCGFVAYDDDLYVYHNPVVKQGLTPSGVVWAFSTFRCSNWHPLTWLSHMLDCQLFGLNAGAHHLVNVGFHLASTLVLFIAFVRMTRRPWRSALVAGIFAVHPLHVESVAWIAERKDVLSTFLGMLALLFYVRYTQKPAPRRYAPVALFFALALMAKPMLVTLPFVLLLLDIWPLGRLAWPPVWRTLASLIWEKAPLFALAAAASVVTFVAQQTTGAVQSLAGRSFPERLVNACIGYMSYLSRAFFPAALGVLYPIHAPSGREAACAFVMLLVATVAALALAKKQPSCLVGWLWYFGMLVPVSGIVQVGTQSTADRYAYLPLVGLSLTIVWFVAERVERRRLLMRAAAVVTCAALVSLGVKAHRQVTYWRSSRSLFERALAVTEGNYIMHHNLGVILAQEGRYDDAVAHYRQALAINPDYEDAQGNLGHELLRSGDLSGAYSHLTAAVRISPERAQFQADLGTVLVKQGKFEEAAGHLEQAVLRAPGNSEFHSNLGYVLQKLGRLDEAIAHYAEAIRLNPESADAHYNMGLALSAQGKKSDAITELSRVLGLNAEHTAAQNALEEAPK